MIGPEPPQSTQPADWRNYVDELNAFEDYPGRAAAIDDAKRMIGILENVLEETGTPASSMDVLRTLKPVIRRNP